MEPTDPDTTIGESILSELRAIRKAQPTTGMIAGGVALGLILYGLIMLALGVLIWGALIGSVVGAR